MREPSVQLQARPVKSVENKAIMLQSIEVRKTLPAHQLRKYTTPVVHKDSKEKMMTRITQSLLQRELELLAAAQAGLLTWSLLPFTPSIIPQLQLSWIQEQRATSKTDLLTILQSGEVHLDPPSGKLKLCDGRVVQPLGSYTFTVSLDNGPQWKIPFDILESAPGLSLMATPVSSKDGFL